MKLTALIATLAFALPAAAQDWNQFRGPDRSGVSSETGLLKEWPKDGPPLAWKATGIGEGYSTVAVVDGKIYTTGDVGAESFLFCIDAKNGKEVWKTRLGVATKKGADKNWNSARSTPSVDGKSVYAIGEDGEILCVAAADGKEVWRKHMRKDFKGEVGPWDYSDGPLVDGKNLIVKPGGKEGCLAALDKESGAVAWRSKDFTESAEYTSLYPCEIGGVKQYVVMTMKAVAGIGTDGKLLWRTERPGKTAICTMPIARDGIVFVASGYNVGCHAYKISGSGGKFGVEALYSGEQMMNHHGGVLLIGDHLYGTTDKGRKLQCVEFKTGKVAWEDKAAGKGSIAAADGHLIVRSEDAKDGTVVLAEASPAGYKEKGRFTLKDPAGRPLWSYPVVAGGKLYLRVTNELHCFDIKAK